MLYLLAWVIQFSSPGTVLLRKAVLWKWHCKCCNLFFKTFMKCKQCSKAKLFFWALLTNLDSYQVLLLGNVAFAPSIPFISPVQLLRLPWSSPKKESHSLANVAYVQQLCKIYMQSLKAWESSSCSLWEYKGKKWKQDFRIFRRKNLKEKRISPGVFWRFHWMKTGSKNGREKKNHQMQLC